MTLATVPNSLPGFARRVGARRRPAGDREIVLDGFAGVGGWGLGEEIANGCAIDIAFNHDATACDSYRVNHPATHVLHSDAFEVHPLSVEPGRPMAHAHFSPDCTHHSKARGAAPVSDRVRGLAWVVLAWMHHRRPRVVTLENVEEFRDWGPTKATRRGRVPIASRKGQTFRAFIACLVGGLPRNDPATAEIMAVVGPLGVPLDALRDGMGYQVEHRELRACDYGAPTIRKRFFLIARGDGEAIKWPEPTHGPRIDANSLERAAKQNQANRVVASGNRQQSGRVRFDAAGDHESGEGTDRCGARDDVPTSRRRMEPATVVRGVKPYRTAAECIDWSIPCSSIFMSAEEAREYGRRTGTRIIRPLKPRTMERIFRGLVRHVLQSPDPFIVQITHSGAEFRGQSIHAPLSTITTAHRGEHALIAPMVVQYNGESSSRDTRSQRPDRPLNTIPTENRFGLVAPLIVGPGGQNFQTRSGGEPLNAILTKPNQAIAAAYITQFYGTCRSGRRVDDPLQTITAGAGGGHAGLVAAYLQTYYGNSDQGFQIDRPAPTVTTRDRISVVVVRIHGQPYVIEDIGMRMLQPQELLRCQFGEFADGWVLHGSKTQQVAGIGNSVCPHVARAIVKANVKIRRVAPRRDDASEAAA